MTYLFIGEDEFSKDIKLHKIKQEFKLGELESFNFEILHSKGLDLKTLQERLLLLPIKAKQRLILIRDAPGLSPNIKQYLLTWLSKPFPHVSLILDARHIDQRDKFFNQISRLCKLVNFRQSSQINAFTLARQIMYTPAGVRSAGKEKRIKPAMRLLRQLLLQGERPEKILGALRYQLHKERLNFTERKKKLAFLLNCDIDIKTGKLKPEFALERLLIRLCYF
jgi:DNA polymerase III delta subunit